MTVATHTTRQPIVGNQQVNVASDVQQHPLNTRLQAVNNGIEATYVYGKATAVLAANAAATIDPATGNIAATGGSVSGNVVPAVAIGQYAFIKVA